MRLFYLGTHFSYNLFFPFFLLLLLVRVLKFVQFNNGHKKFLWRKVVDVNYYLKVKEKKIKGKVNAEKILCDTVEIA